MAARDVVAISGDVNIYCAAPAPQSVGNKTANAFRKLFDKLENEAASDRILTAYIQQLEVYTRQVENEEVVGLEAKLRAAGRDRQVMIAAALKENMYGEIKANMFSKSYQMIVATLIAKVHDRFDADIRPLIEADMSASVIDQAVSNFITTPISNELDDCPQFENGAIDYVRGMLYFLTGNCHIRWDKC